MLNLNCAICAEIFAASDDVHCTSCGHMFHINCLNQWLQRSETCPQCRNKCTDRNVIRVYFNLANLDVSRIDVGSLQEQLDNVQLQLRVKETEQQKCMKTIAGLEKDLQSKSFLILNYVEKIKMLESVNKFMESVLQERKELVESIVEEYEKLNGCFTNLESSYEEHKKLSDKRISQLESENYQLLEKITNLEDLSKTNNNNNSTFNSNNSTIGLKTPIMSPYMTNIKDDKRLTISSPYLKIKPCCVLLSKISPTKWVRSGGGAIRKTTSDLSEKDLILKKPRLGLVAGGSPTTSKPSTSNFAFNNPFHNKSDDELEIVINKYEQNKRKSSSTSKLNSASNFAFNGFGGSDRVNPFENKSDDDPFENKSDDELEIVGNKYYQNKQKSSSTSNLTLSVPW